MSLPFVDCPLSSPFETQGPAKQLNLVANEVLHLVDLRCTPFFRGGSFIRKSVSKEHTSESQEPAMPSLVSRTHRREPRWLAIPWSRRLGSQATMPWLIEAGLATEVVVGRDQIPLPY